MIERTRRLLRLYMKSPLWLRRGLAIVWAASIWWSSSGTVSTGASEFWQIFLMNGAHVVIYGVLAALIFLGLLEITRRPAVIAFILSSAYGCVDEIHQMSVAGRHPSMLDVLSDVLGSALFLAALVWLQSADRRSKQLMYALMPASLLAVFLASLS